MDLVHLPKNIRKKKSFSVSHANRFCDRNATLLRSPNTFHTAHNTKNLTEFDYSPNQYTFSIDELQKYPKLRTVSFRLCIRHRQFLIITIELPNNKNVSRRIIGKKKYEELISWKIPISIALLKRVMCRWMMMFIGRCCCSHYFDVQKLFEIIIGYGFCEELFRLL